MLTWNRKNGITVHDPTRFIERAALATTCVGRMNVAMPVLVDDLDNTVASTYGGWPIRLWLIDRDGRVAYRANQGPCGFKPDQLRTAIEAQVSRDARPRSTSPSR